MTIEGEGFTPGGCGPTGGGHRGREGVAGWGGLNTFCGIDPLFGELVVCTPQIAVIFIISMVSVISAFSQHSTLLFVAV